MTKSLRATSISDVMKDLLADPSARIRLDDFVVDQLKRAISSLALDRFSPSAPLTEDAFPSRLKEYESAVGDLLTIVILLARWARGEQLRSLQRIFVHLAAVDKGSAGTVFWLRFGWYPAQLLMYAAGIAVLDAKNYEGLAAILLPHVHEENRASGTPTVPLLVRVAGEMSEIGDAFKQLLGREREFVPKSEYLLNVLRGPLDRELFLGLTYENLFDRFEVLSALVFADLTYDARGGAWGPIGRFGWKFGRGGGGPFEEAIRELEMQGATWPPLAAGFFGGKSSRAIEIAKAFRERLGKLNWW